MILELLYFFVPAYIANMMPIFVMKLPLFNAPIDLGAKINGKRLFGKNKTWRGLIFGVIAGVITFWIQKVAYMNGMTALALIDYSQASIILGAAMGFGALLGDALESAVKRQLDRRPGKPFVPWDQVDFILGAMLFTIPYWVSLWWQMLVSIVIIIVIDMIIQRIGYLLKLKKDPL